MPKQHPSPAVDLSKTNPQVPEGKVGIVDTPNLRLEWVEAPWDSAIFGFPVLQISRIEVVGPLATADLTAFEAARDRMGAGLLSCRLSHEQLKESMLLEEHGFRFIEMVYMPELDGLTGRTLAEENTLSVKLAEESDLPSLMEIAGDAFHSERFHVDPRLDSTLGDERYRRWVLSALSHPSQRLYVVSDGLQRVAFFVTEIQADGTCYWHLNAVASRFQGQGYGRRAWQVMVNVAKEQGAQRVRTCIAARNYRVLNLYARLGFSFPPPLMTFHWVRDA